MSHVISSQPSSTSPYKPTETEIPDEAYGTRINENPPRIITGDARTRQDCCCYVDENDGCCLYVFCRIFSRCFQSIGDCTEACCDSCANCLNDCCEDKPRDQTRRQYYNDTTESAFNYDNASTDNWLVGVTSDPSYSPTRVDTDRAGSRHETHCHVGNDDGGKCDSGGSGDFGGGCDSGGGGDTGGCCDD